MLKRVNRLAKDKEISATFARGRTFFNPLFTAKFLSGATSKQFTIVVSNKVFKNAVARNRLKRILREQIRHNLASFKSGKYIIMAKPKLSRLPEADILLQFKELCRKLKV